MNNHIGLPFTILKLKDEEALVSVSKVKDHPILMRTIDSNGYAINLLEGSSTKRRQEFPDFYKVNGAIYIKHVILTRIKSQYSKLSNVKAKFTIALSQAQIITKI